jgi:phenylalanyl-tRNA synthetase beta subunit
LSDALTFHVFEIDGVEKKATDEVLDVKVTPNRGHDCLSHRGIAKELSAILKLPIKDRIRPARQRF